MDPSIATLYASAIGVIGVIIGVVLGFIAEPIKTFIDNKVKLKRLRRSVHGELGYNYLSLMTMKNLKGKPSSANVFQALLRLDVYEYTRTDPLLFYQLEESSAISLSYITLNQLVKDGDVELIEVYIRQVQNLLKAGILQLPSLDSHMHTTLMMKKEGN